MGVAFVRVRGVNVYLNNRMFAKGLRMVGPLVVAEVFLPEPFALCEKASARANPTDLGFLLEYSHSEGEWYANLKGFPSIKLKVKEL